MNSGQGLRARVAASKPIGHSQSPVYNRNLPVPLYSFLRNVSR